jgi:hypothetical protein
MPVPRQAVLLKIHNGQLEKCGIWQILTNPKPEQSGKWFLKPKYPKEMSLRN